MRLMVIAVVAVELQCFVPWSRSVVVLNQFACVRAMCVKVLKHYRKSLVLLQAKLFVPVNCTDHRSSARRVSAYACIEVIFLIPAFLGWKDSHLAF